MSGSLPTEFEFSEARFAEKVGLSRDEITELRKKNLESGVDWKKKSGQIALTRPALVRLCRLMRIRPSTLELSACVLAAPETNGAAGEALRLNDRISETNPRKLTVLQLWLNTRVLLAGDKDPLDGAVPVIVGDSENFVVGMTIPVMPDPLHKGFWRLVGPLPPRKGRWF